MKIRHFKQIGICYTVFATFSVFLYQIDKITVFPIITGIMLFLIYFVVKAFWTLAIEKESRLIDFSILYGVAMLFATQVLFLISDSLKTYALVGALFVTLILLVSSYILKTKNNLSLFVVLVSLVTGLFSANF